MAADDTFADFNARVRQQKADDRGEDYTIEMACPDCGTMMSVGELVTSGCPLCDVDDEEPA